MRFFREKFALLSVVFFGSFLFSAHAQVDDARVELVDRTITVISEILIWGPAATRPIATQIQSDIIAAWGKQADGRAWTYLDRDTGAEYTVRFDVRVSLYGGKERANPNVIWDSWNPDSRRNYVKIVTTGDRSFVHNGDEGVWKTDCGCFAHEFGHLIGFKDRYHKDKNGKDVSDAGWESNIMDDSTDAVEQRNIDVIAARVLRHRSMQRASLWPTRGEPNVFHDEIDIAYTRD